jgi:tetratricopeptide (TPR) repeat protein
MRVAAARTVANVASMERDASAASSLLSLVAEIPITGLDDDTQAQLSLTRGQLLWLTGNVQESYAEVERAVEALSVKRIANTVAVQLTLGLGTLRMHQGRYADALIHYDRASEMAKRLGNDTQLAFIFGNLAMCHGRIGNYKEQLEYSLLAPHAWGNEFGGLLELQLSYCQILALTVLGRTGEALSAIETCDSRLRESLPAWMRQAWQLWKADLLMCAGKQLEASRIAMRVFREFGMELHSPGFAGPFARWLSHVANAEGTRKAAKDALKGLLPRLRMYDALDQVEIMCAARAINQNRETQYDRMIQERLHDLPSEITRHLKRVGSLI